jgi:CRP-like cAMP-binding protein
VGADREELLRRHPLFERLEDAQLERFAAAGELELFQPGEDIVIAGTLGDSFYLLLSGAAEVYPNARGEGMPIARLCGGEFFGEMSLLEPALRSATVRAADLTEVFRIPQFSLANLLQDDPPAMTLFLVSVVRVLSARLRRTNQLVGSVKELAQFLSGSLV